MRSSCSTVCKRKEMGTIVAIQLQRLQSASRPIDKIVLKIDDDATNWLAEKGYDPAYGARPLKRVIQKQVQDPLAEKILLGEILDGSTVKITVWFGPAQLQGGRKSRPVVEDSEAA